MCRSRVIVLLCIWEIFAGANLAELPHIPSEENFVIISLFQTTHPQQPISTKQASVRQWCKKMFWDEGG